MKNFALALALPIVAMTAFAPVAASAAPTLAEVEAQCLDRPAQCGTIMANYVNGSTLTTANLSDFIDSLSVAMADVAPSMSAATLRNFGGILDSLVASAEDAGVTVSKDTKVYRDSFKNGEFIVTNQGNGPITGSPT